MPDYRAAEIGFSQRPLGTRPVCLENVPSLNPRRPSLREADYAVLMIEDARVHVRKLREESDGSYTAEIYGYEGPPLAEREAIPLGDSLSFSESHVFTYSVAAEGNGNARVEPARRRRNAGAAEALLEEDSLAQAETPPQRRASRGSALWRLAGVASIAAIAAAGGYSLGQLNESPAPAQARVPVVGPAFLRLDTELRSR